MKNNLNLLFVWLFISSCSGISCNFLAGRYYNKSDRNATNYLVIKDNGTYFHYYKKDSVELYHKGVWQKAKNENCVFEFKNWKSYNERGQDYDDYGIYLLFVNGNYLDNGPDGNSASSFENTDSPSLK
ncbi:hypothetical protein [Flavobacterium sp.]|jgi:hypothetical protein|uniref:hypothetical protein n=1 Tax=Flavobacterium sp. TaxID=239 RepID=UPI0037C0CDB2